MWTPGRTLYDIEKEAIYDALRFYRGNKTKTAESIGISVRGLDYKLEEYEGKKKMASSDAGNHVEPDAKEDGPKRDLSMRERKEVQEMSSRHTSKGNPDKRVGRENQIKTNG